LLQSRRLLQHFLAALAYRTQKALRDAPAAFADFDVGSNVRTPHELVWHMTGVIGYARTMLRGGTFEPPRLDTFDAEVARFHDTLTALRDDFADPTLTATISDEQFLQGQLSDAMTHAGQLAMLRRLFGSPVASENFIHAAVDSANVGRNQAQPRAPDTHWAPHLPPPAPGPTVKYTRDVTRTRIGGSSPFLIVRDVPASLAFYRDQLGFDVTFEGPEPNDIFFGIVNRGGAQILMKAVDVEPVPNHTRDIGRGIARWDAFISVPDPDALPPSMPRAASRSSSRCATRTTACAALRSRTPTATCCSSAGPAERRRLKARRECGRDCH